LNHAEEVVGVAFPSAADAPEVLEPGEYPFDFPAVPIAAKWPSILSLATLLPVRSNHLDTSLAHPFIQRIAIVSLIADHALGEGADVTPVKRGLDER
jgi:hypothetical protein